MTVKEAILKSLLELNRSATYIEIADYIRKKKIYDFGNAKTPNDTISAQLGAFIRDGDDRIQRRKIDGKKAYEYFLTNKSIDLAVNHANVEKAKLNNQKKENSFKERDLHPLLATYLKAIEVNSKTIHHEKSNQSDDNQTWTHPDMIGVKFFELKSTAAELLRKTVNQNDAFRMFSYELKKEIKTDAELKKFYFQAVSNSSWANYGYLVAHKINPELNKEIERLNESFGIGVILIDGNLEKSKILFPSMYKDLDFRTIDKLCNNNNEFREFIEGTEKIVSASDKYLNPALMEFKTKFDKTLDKKQDLIDYCVEKGILSSIDKANFEAEEIIIKQKERKVRLSQESS